MSFREKNNNPPKIYPFPGSQKQKIPSDLRYGENINRKNPSGAEIAPVQLWKPYTDYVGPMEHDEIEIFSRR
jgi:hypothetical protein